MLYSSVFLPSPRIPYLDKNQYVYVERNGRKKFIYLVIKKLEGRQGEENLYFVFSLN